MSNASTASTVVIVGGGIGGLAAALAAAGQGHQVTVLERGTFTELGAGIQIAANGMAALDRLGIGAQVRADAVAVDELRFHNGVSGQHVASMPLGEPYRVRFGWPYLVVHRGELHRMLVDACRSAPSVLLRPAAEVTGYQQDGRGVRVGLGDGETLRCDALVGADGIRSVVREQLVGDGAPKVAGITVYRSVIPMDQVPADLRSNSVCWWAGPCCHLVHYPIAGGTHLNLAPSSENGATTAFSSVPVDDARVREEFAALGGTAQRLVALGRDWKAWALLDRDPVDVWTDNRVVLLGDAAHPMLHYVAQGACQALEDAVVLGEALAESEDLPRAFAGYNAARRRRTAAVQRLSRESIRLWHCAGADARRRDEAMAGMSDQDMYDYVGWMHRARGVGGRAVDADVA